MTFFRLLYQKTSAALSATLCVAIANKYHSFHKIYAQPKDSPSPIPLAEDVEAFGPNMLTSEEEDEEDPVHIFHLRRAFLMKNYGCIYEYDYNEPVLSRGGDDPILSIQPVHNDEVEPLPYLNQTCYCIDPDVGQKEEPKEPAQPAFRRKRDTKESNPYFGFTSAIPPKPKPTTKWFAESSYETPLPYPDPMECREERREYKHAVKEHYARKKEERRKVKKPAIGRPEIDFRWPSYHIRGPVFPHPMCPRRSILEYEDFIICYDQQTKSACWTLELVNVEDVDEMRWDPAEDLTDPAVPKEFSAEESDYRGAADRFKKHHLADVDFHINTVTNDCKDACLFTNVVPQAIDCSDPLAPTVWDKLFEYITELKLLKCEICILTGPLYLPEKREDGRKFVKYELVGANKVAVPTHFFKVIVTKHWDEKTYVFECYKFANKAIDNNVKLSNYRIDRCQLEKEAGFKIFPRITEKFISKKSPFPPGYEDIGERF